MKAIIIGASSGIGMQLSRIMSEDGVALGLTGRRLELLNSLKDELPYETNVEFMDISKPYDTMETLNSLIKKMGKVDLIVVSAGIGHINYDLAWELEQETIYINILGVTAVINVAMQYFLQEKCGHLAVISSVASLRGSAECPAYNASKSYLSNYIEGIRCKVKKQKLNITITDIKPGLVDTAMAKGDELFWVMPLDKASKQIYTALKNRVDTIYVTKRWKWIACLLKMMPKAIYYKM